MPYGVAGPGPYGLFPPHPVYGQVPSVGQQGVGQNGHGELAEPTKRVAVEIYLSRLSPQELGVATGSSVVAALAGQGIAVEETYAGRILGEWRVAHPNPQQASAQGRPVSRSRRGAGPLVGSVEAALDRSARRGSGPDGHAAEPHSEGGSR